MVLLPLPLFPPCNLRHYLLRLTGNTLERMQHDERLIATSRKYLTRLLAHVHELLDSSNARDLFLKRQIIVAMPCERVPIVKILSILTFSICLLPIAKHIPDSAATEWGACGRWERKGGGATVARSAGRAAKHCRWESLA